MEDALYSEVYSRIKDICFPCLVQPNTINNSAEYVCWALQVYCYSLVAHMREVLGGVEQLESAHPFLVCLLVRNLHEWTAQAGYMSERLVPMVKEHNFHSAWELLEQALTGNRWMNQEASDPQPIRVDKAIKVYQELSEDSFGSDDALDQYRFLCELSHPNGIALIQYQTNHDNGLSVQRPSCSGDFLDILHLDLISLLWFINKLLEAAQESIIRSLISGILQSIAGNKTIPNTNTQAESI